MYDIFDNNWKRGYFSVVTIKQCVFGYIFLDIFDFVHNVKCVIYNLYYIFLQVILGI